MQLCCIRALCASNYGNENVNHIFKPRLHDPKYHKHHFLNHSRVPRRVVLYTRVSSGVKIRLTFGQTTRAGRYSIIRGRKTESGTPHLKRGLSDVNEITTERQKQREREGERERERQREGEAREGMAIDRRRPGEHITCTAEAPKLLPVFKDRRQGVHILEHL